MSVKDIRRSAVMSGRATMTMVTSTSSMKAPRQAAASGHQLVRVSVVVMAARVGAGWGLPLVGASFLLEFLAG
ncbi:hypothetical protein GCM10010176_026120 [Nonomuraea spiralis]|nr:hypothetical protein GCM10010176_026120 [Nonomuraea spiralis]